MMEFPGNIEARKCGNSKGKLKKKQKFQGVPVNKNSCGISWGLFDGVLIFELGISKGCHNFAEFPGVKVCFLLNPSPPPLVWFFSGIIYWQILQQFGKLRSDGVCRRRHQFSYSASYLFCNVILIF